MSRLCAALCALSIALAVGCEKQESPDDGARAVSAEDRGASSERTTATSNASSAPPPAGDEKPGEATGDEDPRDSNTSTASTDTGSEAPEEGEPEATEDADEGEGSKSAGALASDEDVIAAYEAATGNRLPAKVNCIVRPASFERVVVVGWFQHHIGCEFHGMFVDGVWADDLAAATADVLAEAGWTDGDAEVRTELARTWLDEVVFAFVSELVTEREVAFDIGDTPEWEAVDVDVEDDGGLEIEGWVRRPSSSKRAEIVYTETTATFGADGALTISHGKRFDVYVSQVERLEDDD